MVDAVITVLLEKLLASLVTEGRQLLELDDQFNKLEDELSYMKTFLKEACNMRRKDQNDIFKKVMSDLRELVYDAEDVIEESQLFSVKLPDGYLHDCMSCCSLQFLKFRYQTANRLKVINQGIKKVKKRMTTYLGPGSSIITSRQGGVTQSLRYPIFIDEANIVGLEDDSAKIREWIFEAAESFLVIGIVGMGGVGKTTLAKKIYNSDSVRGSFHHTIFVVISQSFKLEDLLKKMLEEMKVHDESLRGKEAEELLRRLRSELEDKKYLVVFDDVWGTNEQFWWESLKPALSERDGCCIIVTTRNEEVVRLMGATDRHIHRPKVLSVENSWTLFAKVAFARNGGRCPSSDIEGIGKEIVTKCAGLPLAIKVIGGMMLGIGDSVNEWRRISEHLKEELAEKKKDEPIMSSLELSYEELPSYLKPCFLCFSMFQEDEIVFINDIIYWWIGEGFVSGTSGRTAFEMGKEHMVELLNRCLLLGDEKDEFQKEFVIVRIHDLVRDMVIKIARDENFTSLDEKGRPEFSVQSRRVSIFKDEIIKSVGSEKGKKSATEIKLRTLYGKQIYKEVLLNKELELCRFKRLRVLHVSFSLYSGVKESILKDWLDGITSLSHLVCLNIEYCALEKLPDSIGNLHNLQILVLFAWQNLKMLPSTIAKLDNLIVFRIDACNLLKIVPDGVGRFSNLEQLHGFSPAIAHHKNASRIGQLKYLGQLRELWLDLTDPKQLEEGELNVLSEIQHLRLLTIAFAENEEMIGFVSKLNHQLSPLQCLEGLRIGCFPGESTPVWLNPTSFPNLQFLGIGGGNLTHIGPEFWERERGVWKIESLVLEGLSMLEEEWERFVGALPSLRMVTVGGCPKLKSFPLDVTADDATWWK